MPNGFAVTAEAYRLFLKETRLNAVIRLILKGVNSRIWRVSSREASKCGRQFSASHSPGSGIIYQVEKTRSVTRAGQFLDHPRVLSGTLAAVSMNVQHYSRLCVVAMPTMPTGFYPR